MKDGVHIRAIEKHDPARPEGPRLLELQVYFLPNDRELLEAIYAAARNAISAELEKRGMTEGAPIEIPAAGDTTKLQ